MTKTFIFYYTPFINWLKNGDKLPVMFFDACLTAKLDFNISDLQRYYPAFAWYLIKSGKASADPMIFYPCFAWYFLIKQGGGAVATIGSTRTAYTHVDTHGIYGGAGYLDVQFFAGYEEGMRLGQVMTSAQVGYLDGVGLDYFTLEEYLVFGDPSLMVGGLPS